MSAGLCISQEINGCFFLNRNLGPFEYVKKNFLEQILLVLKPYELSTMYYILPKRVKTRLKHVVLVETEK